MSGIARPARNPALQFALILPGDVSDAMWPYVSWPSCLCSG